jgi:copper homeostasis protein
MTLEICGDSLESYKLAKQFAVKRIELCSALTVGGLTPSMGLIEECAKIGGVEIHAMIRHLEGGFVYSDKDVETMKKDISNVSLAGGHGVVFGCLTLQNEINLDQNKQLFSHAKSLGLEVTFHRAFDFCSDPKSTLNTLIEIGFDRLLTSGQEPTAIEGKETIRSMVHQSNGKIEIMAGSGVSASNAKELFDLGVDALHFTSHKINSEKEKLGMGNKTIPKPEKIASIMAIISQA